MSYYLRQANEKDIQLVFDWANDEGVRANSFHQEPIAWETHERWYRKVMESSEVFLYILMDFMKPLGMLRINIETEGNGEKIARISYSIDAEYRGKNLGKRMLAMMEQETSLQKQLTLAGISEYVAEVKPENEPSKQIFENLKYQKTLETKDKIVFKKRMVPSETKTKKNNSAVSDLQETKREASFEVLRVVSMFMVILLHYLSKGNLLKSPLVIDNWGERGFWILEAFSVVCVNVYVLISGYFLVDREFKLGKLVKLWCQVFFYSVLIAAVCLVTGVASPEMYLNFFNLQFFAFPIINGHYWFATAYLLLYLFLPILNPAIRALKKKQLMWFILFLLVPFSLAKSFLPVPLDIDHKGVSFVWFICLYLIAAYVKLYGIPFFEKKGRGLFVYLSSVAGILLCFLAYFSLVRQTGKYEYSLAIPYHYNFIFVLTGALGLFYCFKNWKPKENILIRFLVRIAPYTFGVYLLHEHLMLRYLWPDLCQISQPYGAMRIVHMILTVLMVFFAGILVDFVRMLLFNLADKVIKWGMKIYYSQKEAFDYLIFGVLATVVNWAAYIMFAYCFLSSFFVGNDTMRIMVSNFIAWVAAVLFAYWTNRTFVFCSKVTEPLALLKEFGAFVGARVFSYLVETLLLFLMVDTARINDLISKLIISVVVVILNYVFSKLWIFKKDTV